MDMLDMILFGGVGFFLAVVFILVMGASSDKQLKQRLERAKAKNTKTITKKSEAISLRRQSNVSWIKQFPRIIDKIRDRIDMAGKSFTINQYLMANGGIALVITLLVMMFGKPLPLALLGGVTLGVGLPHFYLNSCIKGRKKRFLKLFPDAIDLIVRGLRAGLPVAKSMHTVVEEIGDPISRIFHEIVEQIALGVTMEKALADMALRLKMTEFDFFVTSIVLQRETGGNLGEILSNLSTVLRQRTMFKLKIKAMAAEARISAMIIGALPFLVFVILNFVTPNYVDILYTDYRGNIACGVAGGVLLFGGFIMYKLTQFEI